MGWLMTGSIIQMLEESRVCKIKKEEGHALFLSWDDHWEVQVPPELLRHLIWELEQLANEIEDE